MKIENFQKRFELSDELLNIMLDGNTQKMITTDKDGVLCSIVFGKDNMPIITEQNTTDGFYKNHALISRSGNDSEKIHTKIYNWLKSKFNI